ILMPALSPTMEKGNLAKWLKKEGDKVKAGDVLAEIETDKATMEFEAIDDGTMGKILVPEGTADVAINQPIAILLQEGEDKSALGKAAPASGASAGPAPSKASGKQETPTAPPAARPASAAAAPAAATASPATAKSATNGGERRFASPLAKRVANALGIDLGQVQGSGPHGRIVKADVESAKPGATAPGAATGRPTPVAPAISDASIAKLYAPGTYDVVPHDQIRKIIAKRLVEAKLTIPHFYLTVDTEIDALLNLRGEINAAAPRDEKGN